MAIERIINTQSISEDPVDELLEIGLRPKTFDDYIGQERIKMNLKLAIVAAKKRNEPIDPTGWAGPASTKWASAC